MQNRTFWTSASVSLALLLILGSVAMIEPPAYRRSTDTLFKRVWRTLSKDELNREAREQNTVAYYEGLLNESSRVSSMNSLITGAERFTAENWDRLGRRRRVDFRFWDLEPGFTNRDYVNPTSDIAVNSHGMADHEYSATKPPGVWRIALLGDSITRGQGAPMFKNYETLLETRLNETRTAASPKVEILNFAVGGYRITQLVDAALEWAPAFEPDVYVLPLSELSVFRRWADHLTTLVQNRVDLKYDHVKRIVAESGLRPNDSSATAEAKIARFRLSTIEWAVRTVRDHAHARGARVVVILLPNGTDPEILQEEFNGVREVLRPMGVRVIDLLDAFEVVDNAVEYRVSETNVHPNERGHLFLYERLYEAIAADPELLALFNGADCDCAAADGRIARRLR